MKKYNLLVIILLTFLFINCDPKKSSEENFTFNEEVLKAQYIWNDKVNLEINNLNNKTIENITFYANDKQIGSSKTNTFSYTLTNEKLGYIEIKAKIVYNGATEEETTTIIELVSGIEPKLLNYTVINTYMHDITAYTQGLEFHNGFLYEGTGNGAGNSTGKKGISSLRKVDYKTGKVLKKVELAEQYFGEGITILNGKIYQLTWQNNEGYIYNLDTFEKEKTFNYFKKMEGWGFTNDGKNLYQSDGSEKIYQIDANTLKEISNINVYSGGTKIKELNELEWVNGKIWANVYTKNAIIKINPQNGVVENIVDLSGLLKLRAELPDTDVLNGIAYNPATKTFFVTGKNWDKLFEIKISEQ